MTGDHGDKWMSAQVKLPAAVIRSQFQLVFEGSVGRSWTGDIAIDDIKVQSGAACQSSGDNGGKRWLPSLMLLHLYPYTWVFLGLE